MSNLLSSSEIIGFTGDAVNLFDTASQFHSITVVKESQKSLSNINSSNEIFGYGNTSDLNNITYIQNSGVFRAVVINPTKDYQDKVFPQIPIILNKGNKIIKVETLAKEYIEQGTTERIIINNETFILDSTAMARNYGGLIYYYFALQKTS